MKKLYFVRHGESEMNATGQFAGTTNTPLTKLGRRQAKLAGKKSKDLKIDLIISSPLSRAHDTAKIIAKEVGYPENKIKINPLLAERSYGSMEGQPYAPGFDLDGIADVESTNDLLLRAKEIVDFINRQKVENILVVSHGSIGRAVRHHLLEEFPFHKYRRLENAEIVQWI